MAIILSTQADLTNPTTQSILGEFGDAIGIPGFPQPGGTSRISSNIISLQDKMNSVLNKLLGRTVEQKFDPNYVESGRQVVIGGGIQGGKVPPLEEANVRQIYTQTPNITVLIKKRTFSSLQHLYDPRWMEPAEKWLFRATKRLIARKCAQMADYERLTKIEKLSQLGTSPAAILSGLITNAAEDGILSGGTGGPEKQFVDAFTQAAAFEKAIRDRQPVKVTTYFSDPSLPVLDELGIGQGVFEITTISTLSTDLSLTGDGNCSFTIEDPYRILIVTEEDIEASLRDTALSGFVDALSSAASLALNTAQSKDALLSQARQSRGRSEISFTLGVGGTSGVTAIIDAIGLQINENNLDDVPEGQELDDNEEELFKSVLSSLETYESAMRKNMLGGFSNINTKGDLAEQMEYARRMMRKFHLGKSIIQPMDTVNVFICGGTRKSGEGEDPEYDKVKDFPKDVGSILGLRDRGNMPDEALLKEEWKRDGQHLRFEDYKKLRTMQFSTDNATHVFGGLVKSVSDNFEASTGKYTLGVACGSNLEWLKLTRFNQEPSLEQNPLGFIFDPLTPFTFETDAATGLPTGIPDLSTSNKRRLSGGNCNLYFDSGPKIGSPFNNVEAMKQDIQLLGGTTINKYQHAPGLLYKWKEGIMTGVYNMSFGDPLNRGNVNVRQLTREIGFFASNKPFESLDAANVLSILITGFPYNFSTFVQTALNTGAYVPDTTINSGRDYFHSLLDVQRSFVRTTGNFTPFKRITVSPAELAQAIRIQSQLSNKSSELTQLRNQQATLFDKINNSPAKVVDQRLKKALLKKNINLEAKIAEAENKISSLQKDTDQLSTNIIHVAGNDISFDIANLSKEDDFRVFGDRLAHATLRRREDVIANRDLNFFIVSDEYDKDFDIQAFVLNLMQQSPDIWGKSWLPIWDLCKQVAEKLNFELFCDANGHIVFRPPQYNRTPASVMNAMLSLSKAGGVNVLPKFISALFQSREAALLKDVVLNEWRIRRYAALLGASDIRDVEQLIDDSTGNPVIFLTNEGAGLGININEVIKSSSALRPDDRQNLRALVSSANNSVQLDSSSVGLFSAKAQRNLQKSLLNDPLFGVDLLGNEDTYTEAVKQIVSITGQNRRDFPEYDKAKVGASKNGQKTPATDIANIINEISTLVSQRARSLRALERILEQNIELGSLDSSGKLGLRPRLLGSVDNLPTEIFNRLIEDDTRDYLGHLSGERFTIKDEHIFNSNFTEAPPDLTTVKVTGTLPLVGEGASGTLAGVPEFVAVGADYDLWRQYGWRADREFHIPYFTSAELQCAPYAVMLLSRQRRNIVTGNVTVIGNEYYQLGDVVYVAHRQLLYYVERVQHSIGYESDFRTTLTLKYGHAPGEYIPTPLDIIGKALTNSANKQSAYRIRREPAREDRYLASIRFKDGETDLFGGSDGARNFAQLKNAAASAKADTDPSDPQNSSRLYVLYFAGDSSTQKTRAENIKNWFNSPTRPGASGGGIGKDGFGNATAPIASQASDDPNDVSKFQISSQIVKVQSLRQCLNLEDLSKAERDLISKGVVAGPESHLLDSTLQNVIEIRLRQPPVGGWPRETS